MLQTLLALAASNAPLGATGNAGRGTSSQTLAGRRLRSQRTVTVFLCGDVMLGRGIDQVLPYPSDPQLHEEYVGSALGYVHLAEAAHGSIRRPVDLAYVWGAALNEWRQVDPDLRIVNLETSITHSDSYVPKGINYRMSPENAGCLVAAGVNCCCLANNHVLDWGEGGLIETLAVLGRHDIATAGAGRNLADAAAPAILGVPGRGRVIVFSFATVTSGTPGDWAATSDRPGVNFLSDLSESAVEQVAGQVRAVAKSGDVVIASIHWGPNWGYAIDDEQRRFAHALIDRAGVSIVHGHSSHHPKALERYRNRLILYGCGDFLNDYEGIAGYEEFRSDLTLMYFASVDTATGDLVRLEMTPLQIRRLRLNRVTSEDAEWLQGLLDRESRQFGSRIMAGPEGRLVLS